ncbi:MAG: hypothetical protein AAFV53_41745, partial [Myxococcota bacterium]
EADGSWGAVARLTELEDSLAEKVQAGEGGGASRADRLGRLAKQVAITTTSTEDPIDVTPDDDSDGEA